MIPDSGPWLLALLASGLLGCDGRGGGLAQDGGATDSANANAEIASIAAGQARTCIVYTNGTLRCWGGPGGMPNGLSRDPIQVVGVVDAAQAALGYVDTCIRLGSGIVQCWGDNVWGTVGDGNAGNGLVVTAPTTVRSLSDVRSIGVGDVSACALRGDGSVSCWGSNYDGMLGTAVPLGPNMGALSATPVVVAGLSDATQLAVGIAHVCAIVKDGAVSCWGGGRLGELGDGKSGQGYVRAAPAAVPGLSGVVQLSAADHTCAVLATGVVSCWGSNDDGQLGRGSQGGIGASPDLVLDAADVIQVSAGWRASTCAVQRSGAVLCWGQNNSGQLGNGTIGGIVPRAAPVIGVPAARQIVVGSDHACAIARDSSLWCWGSFGLPGSPSPTPVRVSP